jgi:hypothetical protein
MPHQHELDTIELALNNARMYAEAINESVIEYFINMAIAEVRAKASRSEVDVRP